MERDTAGDSPSLSESVIREIAEHTGKSPEELNPPLFEVIDPDALDTIFRAETGLITFEYHGYAVTVDHSGNVEFEASKPNRA